MKKLTMEEIKDNSELTQDDRYWINKHVNAYENVSGGSKRQDSSQQNLTKLEAIDRLKKCNYRTSPKIIAYLLEIIFIKNPSRKGHWLYISQIYTPKTINAVIYQMLKTHRRGDETIINASAYFTKIIKLKKKRKKFRSTNGGSKRQDLGGATNV